mmetsp:Transcript_111558/g.315014  ORF Transcript_111558/g.315014 Transcript_111558/m.315014 type:complete len:522 (+) Transcript_111558:685-2250(+)
MHVLHHRDLDDLVDELDLRDLHWLLDDFIDVLDLRHLHGLLYDRNNGHVRLLVDGNLHMRIHVLDPRNLHCLLDLLEHWHLSLHDNRYVYNLVDELNLGYFNRPLDHFGDDHRLNDDLRNVRDYILHDQLLPLDRLLDDLRLLDLHGLNAVLDRGVRHSVRDFGHLNNSLLHLYLRHLDGLLNKLRLGDLDHHFDWVRSDFLLGLHHRDVDDLLLLLRHMDVDVLIYMNVVRALLLKDLGHVDDLFLCHRHRHLNDLFDGLMHHSLLCDDLRHVDLLMHHALLLHHLGDVNDFLLRRRNVDLGGNLDRNLNLAFLLDDLRHMNDLLHSHRHRDVHDLLHRAVLHALLLHNLRYMDNLLDQLLHSLVHNLRNIDMQLPVYNLRDFLNLLDDLNGRYLNQVLLYLTLDETVLVHIDDDRRLLDLGGLADGILSRADLPHLEVRRLQLRHCGVFGLRGDGGLCFLLARLALDGRGDRGCALHRHEWRHAHKRRRRQWRRGALHHWDRRRHAGRQHRGSEAACGR